MARPKKPSLAEPLLTARTPHPGPLPIAPPTSQRGEGASNEPPKTVQYTPPTSLDRWQVEQFELLAIYFSLVPVTGWAEAMVRFHGFAEADTNRWFYVRRRFGIAPLIPAADCHPDDLRSFTHEELCAATGLKPDQLTDELTAVRVGWESWQQEMQRMGGADPAPQPAPHSSDERGEGGAELALGDTLLRRFDFDKSMFAVEIYDAKMSEGNRYVPRLPEKTRQEMEWFVAKLMRPEWQKMLAEPMASSMARTALMNELFLRRFDMEMMALMPNTPKFRDMSSARSAIEKQYSDQMEALALKFPELAVAGRVSFRAVVSDLNLAHRQYYGKRDRRLWDKVHTSAEIVFLTRTSVQLPLPRYRLGWQVAVVEAIHGLYDPNFRSQLKKNDLKRLDNGFRQGVAAAKMEAGEEDVDLEKGVIPGEPGTGTDEFDDYLTADKEEIKT